MVKIVAICLALVAASHAAPQQPEQHQPEQHQPDQPVQILKQDSIVSVDGYHFEFETSDGTAREEQGELKDAGSDHEALSVKGSYRYVAPDGQHYAVTFLADENGFQPSVNGESAGAAAAGGAAAGSPDQPQPAQPQYQF